MNARTRVNELIQALLAMRQSGESKVSIVLVKVMLMEILADLEKEAKDAENKA